LVNGEAVLGYRGGSLADVEAVLGYRGGSLTDGEAVLGLGEAVWPTLTCDIHIYLYILKLVHRPRFPILYISLLYQYNYYTSTTGGTAPIPPDDTRQVILSTARHCRSCPVLTIATTHFASVACLALALARLPASTRCRRARHAA
jgi:hypothetical protein